MELVQVPRLQFAMIDGAIEKGSEPGKSAAFADATQALYSISYTLKFMLKQRKDAPLDYPVMALEGLWWVVDGHFDINIKDNWFYTLMMLTPEQVNEDKTRFAQSLIEEAEHDMLRMGLTLDTLKIQNVTDEVGYLDSIGRIKSAEIKRDATVAEAATKAESMVRDAANVQDTEVVRVDAAVRTLQAAGLEVMGGFIVGFDSDPRDIFRRQLEFIQRSGVVTAMVGLLNALPQTALYQRLAREDYQAIGSILHHHSRSVPTGISAFKRS